MERSPIQPDYQVIRDMELRVEPIEMKPRVEHTPVQRVQEAWRQRRHMRRIGRDGRR